MNISWDLVSKCIVEDVRAAAFGNFFRSRNFSPFEKPVCFIIDCWVFVKKKDITTYSRKTSTLKCFFFYICLRDIKAKLNYKFYYFKRKRNCLYIYKNVKPNN